MSSATRRIRQELASQILSDLGMRVDISGAFDHRPSDDAAAALCQRMQVMIAQICEVGITKAKIAREIHVDPAALSELAEGVTSRLGLESLWAAYQSLEEFIERASAALHARPEVAGVAQGELLGFSAHPDRAKVTGTEALATMGANLLTVVGEREGAIVSLGPHVKGASAVYVKDGHWVITAIVYRDTPEEMTRVARDEIWHIEQWLRKRDAESDKTKRPKPAYRYMGGR
jgi:hypothetical protein